MSVDWRTQLAAARQPPPLALRIRQAEWDATWRRFFRAALARLRNHKTAIEEANQRMTDEGYGPRPVPEPKETQQ